MSSSPKTHRFHDIVPEDTVDTIALRYSTTPEAILALNNFKSASEIHSRTMIKVPLGSAPGLAAAPPKAGTGFSPLASSSFSIDDILGRATLSALDRDNNSAASRAQSALSATNGTGGGGGLSSEGSGYRGGSVLDVEAFLASESESSVGSSNFTAFPATTTTTTTISSSSSSSVSSSFSRSPAAASAALSFDDSGSGVGGGSGSGGGVGGGSIGVSGTASTTSGSGSGGGSAAYLVGSGVPSTSGPTRVGLVQRSKQEAMEKQDNSMFEL